MSEMFILTTEHLQLLQRMYVGWQNCESGAPEINPKRPYGNSSVKDDIHEILTGESIGCIGSARDELTDDENSYYRRLHHETETALQIVLIVGKFEVGTYAKTNRYDDRSWNKVPV